MTSRSMRVPVAVMALATIVPALPASQTTAEAALPTVPVVNNDTRAGALAAYRTNNVTAVATPVGWSGSVVGCNPGVPTAASQAATLNTINYYRAMVGIAPVRFDAGHNAKAQQAALMMEANNTLSHQPPTTWKCWTAGGADAAKTGNLHISTGATNGAKAVNAYIADTGNDATLGHRRWLLDPALTVMGNGQTNRANVIKLWGTTPPRTNPSGTPAFVSWPDAGYVPKALVPANNIWTLSASDAAVDMSTATVKVSSNGAAIPVTVTRPTKGFGKPAIGFKPAINASSVTSDRAVKITVSGMKKAGVVLPARTWTTTLFDQTKDRSPQSLSWLLPTYAYKGQRSTLSAKATSGLTVAYTSATPTVCSVSGNYVTYLAEGTCTVRGSQVGNATWAPAATTRSLQVWNSAKKANVITWAQPVAAATNTTATLAAKASSGLAVTYTSATPTVCAVSGNRVTHRSGGTCTVTARQGGSITVNVAPPVTRSWAVKGLAANTITWNVPTSVKVGQSVPLNPTATSGSTQFSYSAAMTASGACRFSSGTLVFGARGSCIIAVSQNATATHAAAKLSKTFTIA